jgi:hypothetical protein
MDSSRVMLLRQVLEGTEWVDRTRQFARSLRRSTRTKGDLLVVGTPEQEPWHFAAHLEDEARYAGVPEMSPTLVRWSPPPGAPPHLAVGLDRLESARRGESLLVVSPDVAPDALLERVDDARRIGATIFALDGGDKQLQGLAHDALIVPAQGLIVPSSNALDIGSTSVQTVPYGLDTPDVSFETVEHLVSLAAGEAADATPAQRRGLRDRLARAIDRISGPQSDAY